MNQHDLEERLNQPGQQAVQKLVRELPEEELSLAWRSELNQKLLAQTAQKAQRTLWSWLWKPTAGLAVAGALAGVLFLKAAPVTGPTSGEEAQALLAAHEQSSLLLSLGQTTAPAGEDGLPSVDEWTQEDVTQL